MANEAVIIEVCDSQHIVYRNCLDGTSISKGTLLKLSGSNLVVASSLTGEVFGGIAAADKLAGDGSTTIGTYTLGVFGLKNNALPAAITCGSQVVMSGANMIRAAVAGELLTGAIVGTIENTSSASSTERVRLKGF